MKKITTIFRQISGQVQVLSVIALMSMPLFFSCVDNDDDVPESMYTAQKMTAGAFLETNQDRFSEFTALLKRTPYFSLMTTYGRYTLFAPTNDAMAQYIQNNGYGSVAGIPQNICDSLARTHIIRKGAFFTSDVPEGNVGLNMLDQYITWSSDSDVTNGNRLIYYVNKNSRMTEFNDSVTNGVVHIVDRVLSSSTDFLPEKMREDSTITLFCEALRLTHLDDSLHEYMDEHYSIGVDSVTLGTQERCLNNGNPYMTCLWVSNRYFKFTAFVEPDSVYHRNGINNIEDLKAYAKRIYDATYPEDAGQYDHDFTHRKNPLNRFVSYHLLNRIIMYNDLVGNELTSQCWKSSVADPEEFYETMCPGTLVRLAMPSGSDQGVFINRRGLMARLYDDQSRGVKVLAPSESGKTDQQALNGFYHYIDDILTFNTHTRDVIFNCRMRFHPSTLSRDFMNCDGRNHKDDIGNSLRGFKKGFTDGWQMSDESFVGVTGNDVWWASFMGGVVVISGRFDVTLRLPCVPKKGTYEIRIGYTPNEERGVIQAYLNNVPCGIPVDMRIYPGDPEIGFISDGSEGAQTAEEIKMQDKALHNRGFMKAMDVWYQGGTGNTGGCLRNNNISTRRVLATESLDPDKVYYLRLRQVLDNPENYCNFNYLEICPKSVYGSPEGEDQH